MRAIKPFSTCRRWSGFVALAFILIGAYGQSAAAGSWRDLETSDDGAISAARGALALLNAQSNSAAPLEMVELVSARSQVVAGMKYELVLDAGLSSCANDGAEHTLEACPVDSPARYTIVVVDQAWQTPRYTLVSHTTEEMPEDVYDGNAEPCMGCPASVGTVDEDVLQAAKAGLALFNQRDDTELEFGMVRVLNASKQVVSGILYHINLLAGPRVCPTGSTEEARIAAWLKSAVQDGQLNQYGDAADTMYTGGSPLFDESTGTLRSLEEYLVAGHPARPWDALCTVDQEAAGVYRMVVWYQAWMAQPYKLTESTLPSAVGGGGYGSGSGSGNAMQCHCCGTPVAPDPKFGCPTCKCASLGSSHAQKDTAASKEDDATSTTTVEAALGGSVVLMALVAVAAFMVHKFRKSDPDPTEASHVPVNQDPELGIEDKLDEEENVELVKGLALKATE